MRDTLYMANRVKCEILALLRPYLLPGVVRARVLVADTNGATITLGWYTFGGELSRTVEMHVPERRYVDHLKLRIHAFVQYIRGIYSC